jgi:hypothetical protein
MALRLDPNPSETTGMLPTEAFPVEIEQTPLLRYIIQDKRQWGATEFAEIIPDVHDFASFLSAGDQWEKSLFQDVQCLSFPEALKDYIETGGDIMLCSDGGATRITGSYGWVISTTDKLILWEGQGPVYGPDPGSFRAEGYGALAVLRFLKRYIEYFDVHTDVTTERKSKFYCDNEGLIKRIKQAMQRNFSIPNSCLKSEYDIEAPILSTIRELQALTLVFTCDHVMGHQELNKNSKWEAFMNDRADVLAADYLQRNPEERTSIPFCPISKIYLHVKGVPVTRAMIPVLQSAGPGDDILNHMACTYDWETTVVDMIDWDAHGKAQATLSHESHLFNVKFIQRLLPVGRRMHRREECSSPACAACSTPIEDDDHIYRCSARMEWRKDTLAGLDKLLDQLKTDPSIKKLLHDVVADSIRTDTPPTTYAVFDPILRLVIAEQTQIGWQQLMRGRFSAQWAILQDKYYRMHKADPRKKTGGIWVKRIILFLWKRVELAWRARNDSLHGVDPVDAATKLKSKMVPIIQAFYDQRLELAYSDRESLLPEPLEDMLTKSASYMETWVHNTRSPLTKALSDARLLAKNNQHDIRTFYQTTPATAPHPVAVQPPRFHLALDSIRRARDVARRMRQHFA